MTNLVDHARRELAATGEDKETADAIIEMVRVFAGMGHSGGSAAVAISILTELLEFKNLTPLTDNPEEWYFHDEDIAGVAGGVWQSKRNGEAFSMDGGKTYYLLSEGGSSRTYASGEAVMHTSRDHLKLKQVQEAHD